MKKYVNMLRIILSVGILLYIMFEIFPMGVIAEDKITLPSKHPYMLVKESDYEHLRVLANQSPWKEWKVTAIEDAKKPIDIAGKRYMDRCYALSEKFSTVALAFILDPGNSKIYSQEIVKLIQFWQTGVNDNIYDELLVNNWGNIVPPAATFFDTLVALDIVYPALSKATITDLDAILKKVGDAFWNLEGSYYLAIRGARGAWATYTGDIERVLSASQDYTRSLNAQISEDGVGVFGTNYTVGRLAGRTHAKMLYSVLCEESGFDKSYYNFEKLKKFYEWMQNGVTTPFGTLWTFGDTQGSLKYNHNNLVNYQVALFSKEAAAMSAFHMGNKTQRGRLYNYLFLKEPLPSPKAPQSKIYNDGGAWLYENFANTNSLAGVLWNCKTNEWHSHKEVNAIALAGYGEQLMTNGGYAGAYNAQDGFSWNYIHDRAVAANVMMINYEVDDEQNPTDVKDHVSKNGNGITEGFTTDYFDYAIGDSGMAIADGKHLRNLAFVHSQDGINGYWILFDNIKTKTSKDIPNLIIKPYSDQCTVVSDKEEYNWSIKEYTENNVNLTAFLATEPMDVKILNGLTARNNSGKAIKYLFNSYKVDENLEKNIVTVLFPADDRHKKANISRIKGSGFSGAIIDLSNNIRDYAIEVSVSGKKVSNGNATFTGKYILYRMNDKKPDFYYVNNGTQFSVDNIGFDSKSKNVSVFMKGNEGAVYAYEETEITFSGPTIASAKGVLVNGQAQNDNVFIENGQAKLTLRKGVSNIKFVSDVIVTEKPADEANVTSIDVIGDVVALLINSPMAIVNMRTTYIDENNMNVVPVIINSRTLVPLRFVAEGLGAKVTWVAAAEKVQIQKDDMLIEMKANEKLCYVNGEEKLMDVPMQVVNERTMVPLRLIAEIFEKNVSWDSTGLIVISNKNDLNWKSNSDLVNMILDELIVH